jgi:ribonuclease P protein component
MISAMHRFRGRKSLGYLHKKGTIVRVQGASLKYVWNQQRSIYRAAVVVSKKVHKSAVVRNRIRRRIYEQIRLIVPPAAAVDLAVMVYDDAFAAMPAADVQRLIAQLIKKAGIVPTQDPNHGTLE